MIKIWKRKYIPIGYTNILECYGIIHSYITLVYIIYIYNYFSKDILWPDVGINNKYKWFDQDKLHHYSIKNMKISNWAYR